eukprot:jgi/Astpho2/6338/Aster-06003
MLSSHDPGFGSPALLVVDMQEHFRDIAQSILPDLNKVISACRQAGIPVFFSQHGHPDPETDVNSSVLVSWVGVEESIKRDTPEWQLMPELQHEGGDHLIAAKDTYDCFQGTDLESTMTNLCCETAARSAFVKNFRIKFLSDGTATSPDTLHQATLSNISFGFGEVLSCAAAVKRLQNLAE